LDERSLTNQTFVID